MKRKTIRLTALLLIALLCLGGCRKGFEGDNPAFEDDIEVFLRPDEKTPAPLSRTPTESPEGDPYYEEDEIRLISQNINVADLPGDYSIYNRGWRWEQLVKKYDPDIVGFQEVNPTWDTTLLLMMEDYDYVLFYRSTDNNEGTPIFWKHDKFDLLDKGHFWLSETPDEESLGWEASYYRICSWVKLRVRKTGSVFFYFNTHFDFTENNHRNSAELIAAQVKKICGNAPVFVTGDFNMQRYSGGYEVMSEHFTDVNLVTADDLTGTYQGYGESSALIDYCFVNDQVIPLDYQVMTDKPEGLYVSDHYGIFMKIALRRKKK